MFLASELPTILQRSRASGDLRIAGGEARAEPPEHDPKRNFPAALAATQDLFNRDHHLPENSPHIRLCLVGPRMNTGDTDSSDSAGKKLRQTQVSNDYNPLCHYSAIIFRVYRPCPVLRFATGCG